MHTVVLFDKANKDGSLDFGANADVFNGFIPIRITALYKGTLSIEAFSDIFDVSHVIAGCFHKDSNLYGIKRIKLTLDDITIYITEKNAAPEKIQKLYYEKRNNFKVI